MLKKILNLYPNLNYIYNDLKPEDVTNFENFIYSQFTIEKRPLPQILKKTYSLSNYISQTELKKKRPRK